MNTERIKGLAKQAGYLLDMFGIGHWDMPECQKFAELIAAEEREACAKVCYDRAIKIEKACDGADQDEITSLRVTAWQINVCADVIRARGNE